MEGFLRKRALELSRHYETLARLHAKLIETVESHGQIDANGGTHESPPKTTPAVPIAEGWEATIYRPAEDDNSQTKVYNPVLVQLRPSFDEGGNTIALPYLFEDAGIWLAIGEDRAINEDTQEELSVEELEGLYSDVTSIIEPYLIEQENQTTE